MSRPTLRAVAFLAVFAPSLAAAQAGDTAASKRPIDTTVSPKLPSDSAVSRSKSSRGARFFRAEPGFTRTKDLPEDFSTQVDTIRFDIKDAFDGADAHTKLDRWGFALANKLHIESRMG